MSQGRHTALTIHLTDAERATLTRWQRSTTIGAGYARRGRLILLIAEGMPLVEVARRAGMSRRFVYTWARRFLQHRVEGLADKPGRGRGHRVPRPAGPGQATQDAVG